MAGRLHNSVRGMSTTNPMLDLFKEDVDHFGREFAVNLWTSDDSPRIVGADPFDAIHAMRVIRRYAAQEASA